MKIFVKAKPGAREDKLVPPPLKLIPDGQEFYTVFVKERAAEGRANEAIIKILAGYLKVSISQVRLISGATSKRKVFEL